jgi:hypothetical protein
VVCELQAAEETPLENVVLYIKGWGDGNVAVKIDGRPVERGQGLKIGHVRTLEGTDLIVWVKQASVRPVRIDLEPR